ncbi:MAG TPA: DNA-binding protein [Spirochaetaceae bacterium]|nr:DNA-binding protein [Spirochaetaceae bacterium]
MELNDLMNMLKNPQAIQAKANELKQKTAALRATGQSGGGMVKVTLSGEMEMLECSIAPEVIDPADPGMIADLVRAAHHDAAGRIQEAIRQQLSESMGGMSLPPGMFGGGNPFGAF